MRTGAFVRIIDGPHKDRYGTVISIDGDLGRVTVKWALGKFGSPTEVNEIFTEVVSKKEYDQKGKDISRKTREEYDAKQRNEKREEKKQNKKHPKSRK